jgi:anionic cell wall polymer biosynthesis LytR-Cps2A-Psr (LCP) family protein
MKTIGKIILTILIILFAAACLLGAAIVFTYKMPGGGLLPLIYQTETPTPTETVFVTLTPTSTITPKPVPILCGKNDQMDILIIARDNNVWNPPSGADAIRYIRVDFQKHYVTSLAIPRDIEVLTPSLEQSYGIAATRLGPLYAEVRDKANGDPDEKAAQAVASAINDTFHLQADAVLIITETLPWTFIDALGGLVITVTEPMPGFDLELGVQSIDGETARKYASYRLSAATEWKRIEQQDRILLALFKKVRSADHVDKIPEYLHDYRDKIITDLSDEQINLLTCVVTELDPNRIKLATIPQTSVKIADNGIMTISDPGSITNLINTLFPEP